jgi:hypothetical protein
MIFLFLVIGVLVYNIRKKPKEEIRNKIKNKKMENIKKEEKLNKEFIKSKDRVKKIENEIDKLLEKK